MILNIQGSSWQDSALRELGTALTQARQWEQAERVSRSIWDSLEQAEALRELGTALTQAEQWEQASQVWAEAERVIATIQGRDEQVGALRDLGTALAQAEALKDLAIMMVRTDNLEHLLHLIQRSWHQVETRKEALTLFSIACVVISCKIEVGKTFFDAFMWVNRFLGG